jgi:hypothetical protein
MIYILTNGKYEVVSLTGVSRRDLGCSDPCCVVLVC